ncbi:MAG: hypothetical protein R3F17_15180, partial [Planctomycetota bacterium]
MRRALRWHWLQLVLMALVTVGTVTVSVQLRQHSESRAKLVQQLATVEVQATAQAGQVWKALTQKLSQEGMAFVRSRHEQMMDGSELRTLVEELTNTAREGQAITGYLGHEHKAELWQELQDQAAMFLTQINSVMGQMSLDPERVRERLKYWDLNLTSLQQALAAVTAHEQDIAAASSR